MEPMTTAPEWITRNVSRLRGVRPATDAAPSTATAKPEAERSTHERLQATLRRGSEALTPRALRRLLAFAEAGADCLYAPMPKSLDDLRRICGAVKKPVNALAAGPFARVSRADFAAAGVARISIGAALARLTHRTILDAGRAMLEDGDFSALSNAAPASLSDPLLVRGAGSTGGE